MLPRAPSADPGVQDSLENPFSGFRNAAGRCLVRRVAGGARLPRLLLSGGIAQRVGIQPRRVEFCRALGLLLWRMGERAGLLCFPTTARSAPGIDAPA